MRTWTPEQLRTLASEATELAHMADVALRTSADFAESRIALAARRIAEIVMPQDLVLASLDRLLSASGTPESRDWHVPDAEARHRRLVERGIVELGSEYIARAPGECFETGRRYKVVAVYDGRMDLECAALDTTVAGVRIDDPALERVPRS